MLHTFNKIESTTIKTFSADPELVCRPLIEICKSEKFCNKHIMSSSEKSAQSLNGSRRLPGCQKYLKQESEMQTSTRQKVKINLSIRNSECSLSTCIRILYAFVTNALARHNNKVEKNVVCKQHAKLFKLSRMVPYYWSNVYSWALAHF